MDGYPQQVGVLGPWVSEVGSSWFCKKDFLRETGVLRTADMSNISEVVGLNDFAEWFCVQDVLDFFICVYKTEIGILRVNIFSGVSPLPPSFDHSA